MSAFGNHLRFGTLTRLYCRGCKEDTLHKGSRCARSGCGHVIQPPAAKPGPESRIKPKARKAPPKETLQSLAETMSFQELQKHLRTSHRVVRKWLDGYGIKTRGQRE